MAPRLTVPELQRRLVYTFLKPVARLCARFRMPTHTLEELARLAYYEELRTAGGMRSLRTVTTVEQSYRDDFLGPEREVELARRVTQALRGGARSLPDLAAVLPDHDEDEVERCVSGLVGAGVVLHTAANPEPRFELVPYLSLVRDDLLSRLSGLAHQLEVVTSAVRTRFLGSDPRPAVARSFSFVGTEAEMARLADHLVVVLREACGSAEDRSLRQAGHERYSATLALAPDEEAEGTET